MSIHEGRGRNARELEKESVMTRLPSVPTTAGGPRSVALAVLAALLFSGCNVGVIGENGLSIELGPEAQVGPDGQRPSQGPNGDPGGTDNTAKDITRFTINGDRS